jgi:hypothetical protein
MFNTKVKKYIHKNATNKNIYKSNKIQYSNKLNYHKVKIVIPQIE